MKLSAIKLSGTAFFITLCFFAGAQAFAQSDEVKTFPSYRAAVSAFVGAISAKDEAAVTAIIGAKAQDLLSSGDDTQDNNARLSFLKRYQEAHSFVREAEDKVVLTVGKSAWQLPFPIVRTGGVWHFDADEGAQELVYRRIGQNELDAIKVCRALYAAQKSYASTGHDGNPAGLYAQHFRSAPGTESGLYWEAKEGEMESPAGALVAEATSEGYESSEQTGRPTPFHGYYYRILTSQGANAPGGVKNYVTDGKMSGGFAIIAYPAEYRGSGVMTFVIGPRGKVFQKDLGQATDEIAKAQVVFDPDSSWLLTH
jgi:Protein of unknown function (DUF2950)